MLRKVTKIESGSRTEKTECGRTFSFFASNAAVAIFIALFAFFSSDIQALAITVTSSAGPVTVTAVVTGTTTTGTGTTSGTTTTGGSTTTTGTTGGTSGGGGGGGGGGGIGGSIGLPTSVTFTGYAYPLSHVELLKDGQEVLDTIAGPDAAFDFSIAGLTAGTFTFSILAEDSAGRRSTLFTIPVLITAGVSSTVSGIFLSPTIDIDKTEVKQGDDITIFGETAPNSMVTIAVHSADPIYTQTEADQNGIYLEDFDTTPLEYGLHNTQAKAALSKIIETAPYSNLLSFTVGSENVKSSTDCPQLRGDFNDDCRVNLIDFSIMAYWYKKTGFPANIDLNSDGVIDFPDFSILAYYWTG